MRKPVWTPFLALLFGAGVFVAPYQPVAATVPAIVHTAHPAGHAQPEKPEPAGAHHHGFRCVLCVVGAGVLPVLVQVVREERQELLTPPLPAPLVRQRTFNLFRSRAPPTYGRAFSSPFSFKLSSLGVFNE